VGVVIVSSTRINLRVDDDLLDQIDERAELLGKNRTEYLLDLAEEDLKHRTPEEIEGHIKKLQAQKRDAETEAQKYEKEIERYQSKLEKYQQREDEYEQAFHDLVEDVRERPRILDNADKRLHRVAKKGGITKNQLRNRVLDELDVDDTEEIEQNEETDTLLGKSPDEIEGGDE